jgi:hypothetical protein
MEPAREVKEQRVSGKLLCRLSSAVKRSLEANTSRCLDDEEDRGVVYSEVLGEVLSVLNHDWP